MVYIIIISKDGKHLKKNIILIIIKSKIFLYILIKKLKYYLNRFEKII